MMEIMKETDHYLTDFTRLENESAERVPAFVQQLRQTAVDRFVELGFPTTRDEEWRFTSVAPITKVPFRLAGLVDQRTDGWLPSPLSSEPCLVFVNGQWSRAHSNVSSLPNGVILTGLAAALTTHPKQVEPYLAQYARFDEQPFVALNTAFLRDGAFLYIPRNTVVEKPIHLRFVSGGDEVVSHPRCLVIAGSNSQVTILESYEETAHGRRSNYFTNTVTEIVAEANAIIDHYKVQEESIKAFHVATLQIHQERDSNVTSHSIGLGGALVRNDVNVVLHAEGCECTLNGLYLADGEQHVDNHTRIDHAKPHCASHEMYKGILDGKARGVFNGKIYVHPDAQKTDAKQTNKTLLLSDDAMIDTKPQLEIYADDVKCTHGATIGQVAADAIFYLRSRGIGKDEARAMLTYAFANDIIGRVKIESIRSRLEQLLLQAQDSSRDRKDKEAAL
jgi:Fe-S cluster assembly protein SufD